MGEPENGPPAGQARPPRFASAVVSTFGTRLLVAALSFVSVVIVARMLGASGRGEVALLTTIAMVTSQFGRLGVEEANANFAGSEPEHRRSLATNSLLLSLLFGGACVAILVPLVELVPAVAGDTDAGLRWLAFASIPILILQAYLTFLIRAEYGFGVTNVSWFLSPLLTVVVNGVLAVFDALTVATAFGTWVAAHALAVVLLVWYLARRLAGFGRPDVALALRTLGFGLKTHAGRMLMVGNYRVDQWFVGAIAGTRELGLYSVAVAGAEVLFYLPTVLVVVQRPYLVRASLADAARRAARVFRVGVLLTLPAAVAIAILAPPLCTLVFGEDFRGSVDDLRVLVIGALGVVALQQLGNALTAQRRPTLATVAATVGFAVTIALDILLIPPYGGLGAAIASAASYTAGGLVVVVFFLRVFPSRARDLVPRPREAASLAASLRRRAAAPQPQR